MKKTGFIGFLLSIFLITHYSLPLVLAGPVSTNYELQQYNYGAGGTDNSSSTNFSLFGKVGEVDIGETAGSAYSLKAGLTATLQANVPAAPTLGNGGGTYYNKLSLVFSNVNNPTDTQFLIAVSNDNFVADTKYVQTDHTVSSSQVWQTYSNWNSGSFNIVGLLPGVTYYVKIAARHGNYTQSPFSSTSSLSTASPTLTFDIDVASSDSETAPPFQVSIGSLTAATVVTAPNKIWIDLSTNGATGGLVYVYGQNNGLLSTSVSRTIPSSSVNLASTAQGYGAIYNTVSQSSGGPFEPVAPYDNSPASDVVGVLDSTKRLIFDSSNQPITSGRASFLIKAKASAVTEAATDYTDALTVIATASF